MHKSAFLLLGAAVVLASSGDRLPEFRQCVEHCIESECEDKPPVLLRLLLWTCQSNCDYLCQQRLTHSHLNSNSRVHQYHGKWPFIRVLGVQEPASVVFSLLNLVPNWIGYKRLQRARVTGVQRTLLPYYLLFAVIGVNTWVWSSVFHVRDFVLTERLDYFSAILSIVYGLFLALTRLFRLDLPHNRNKLKMVAAILGLFYLGHISYLSLIHFDYGYNMAAGVVLGLIQNSLWVTLGIKLYRQTKSTTDLLPAILVVLIMGGMSFELFDFSPFGLVFDAHSLWHLSTVLPTAMWYQFMLHDLNRSSKSVKLI
ncbi:Protein PER1 [Wickerhamiella sorbophila]|uniref:Post-GPI attachment to proteins factor 3 n=1 Tax=Wickerhamiella sorbophila TaxID=45607 RepID=A0A2T0FNQ5_9ASCO|nr:Protein PER1 [Wickerhamiella sorbophila]PRT56614.1 Protein PER1 [Wickerhamiella sorbophila]